MKVAGLVAAATLVALVGAPAAALGGVRTPGHAGHAGRSDRGGRTVVRTVDPVTSTGLAAGYRVVSRHHGDCWTGSGTVAGAQRCLHQNLIMDPCWADPRDTSGHVAVCPTAPWSKRLVLIRSKDRLLHYPSQDPERRWPLGVELANGWHCAIADGARSRFHGQTVNWDCGRLRSGHYRLRGGIAGRLDQGQARWTAHVLAYHPRRTTYTSRGRLAVTAAWFGQD